MRTQLKLWLPSVYAVLAFRTALAATDNHVTRITQTEWITLSISLVALAISIFNLLIGRADFRRKHLGRLTLESHHKMADSQFEILATNTGARPLTVERLCIGYGLAPASMATLVDIQEPLALVSLGIGDSRAFHLMVDDLRAAIKTNNVSQESHGRLWIRAKIAGSGVVDRPIYVDERIITFGVDPSKSEYVATDTLLGFSPIQSGGTTFLM